MKKLSATLIAQFKALLFNNNVPEKYHPHYLKWLRYYLDFCHKYGFDQIRGQALYAFCDNKQPIPPRFICKQPINPIFTRG